MSASPLRRALQTAADELGTSMKNLTVMSEQTDPFRLDTPGHHRDAKWLADTMTTLGLGARRIHNRGLHYAVLGQVKPDGSTYVSDDDCWTLLEDASNYARWLGYIPFDRIADQRNSEPVVRIREPLDPQPYINVGIDVHLPDADEITPTLGVDDFEGVQPNRIVIVGEKSSLYEILSPIADSVGADLYLPTGDISNTHVYRIAKTAADDGRPMVVLYFADADPSGWNMGIVISRKLQAFKISHFPELEFQVHRAALTVEQVQKFGLPSTPLKPEEKRADKWRQAFGVEQTEIDALATLRPELLRQIALDAIAPFYDFDLDQRVTAARDDWITRALDVINAQLDGDRLGRIHADAERKISAMHQQIAEINDSLRVDVDDFDLPPIDVPQARLTQGLAPEPLIDSRWSWVTQTRRLIDSKQNRPPEEWPAA
jgi:hypothetical protein